MCKTSEGQAEHGRGKPLTAVFEDPAFRAMPGFGAADAQSALEAEGIPVRRVCERDLGTLGRAGADVLVLPYLDGTFSEAALAGIGAFHAAGGGLVILGDLPHRGCWYPLRNVEGWRLRMTRCMGAYRIAGLSDAGMRILGMQELPHASFFAGRTFSALRTTAFPPDVTHLLLDATERDMQWQATPLVAVERYGEPFLGARFAMVGFNGGEPRENAVGVYQLPWDFDPGLLTREWKGMAPLLARLVRWCMPRVLAARLELCPVHPVQDPAPLRVFLRNHGTAPVRGTVRVSDPSGIRGDWIDGPRDIPAGDTRLELPFPARPPGIHRYRLETEVDGMVTAEHETCEHVLSDGVSGKPGLGFSTYWAFPGCKVLPAFRDFCRDMQERGYQYVRVNIPWEDVEPEPGRYDWTLTDGMMDFARQSGLIMRFWMFPTTRGSGLADAGVPLWSLEEPALTADGRPGFFPTLWSPFYRRHYFNMTRALAARYAGAPELDRLIIDFGNSDFPYGYFYYGGDNTLFDYSPHEQEAFRDYVRRQSGGSVETAAGRLGIPAFQDWSAVRVPLPAQEAAWRVYLDFRAWSVQDGIHEVERIVAENAPAKLSPDLPGHGAGSIADLSSFGLDAKRRHLREELPAERELCRLHNAGTAWGGEAWQVGARYADYDDALFQSLRLNADYFSLPGVDLGLYGEDTARIGFIRRMVMGARRDTPRVAVFDHPGWNAWQSLAQVASRLDVEVDLLQAAHRHDYACYKVVVAAPDPWQATGTVTGGGGSGLMPGDAAWWCRLRDAVEGGLELLLFPGTVQAQGLPLRSAFGMPTVRYGERRERSLQWPASFGGGAGRGHAAAVHTEGLAVVRDQDGEALLIRLAIGKGALWLAGYDTAPDSLDGILHYEQDVSYATHTLTRFLKSRCILPSSLESGECNAWKSVVRRGDQPFLLVFSHQRRSFAQTFTVQSDKPVSGAWDLATGERIPVRLSRPGWWDVSMTVHPRQGRYVMLEP